MKLALIMFCCVNSKIPHKMDTVSLEYSFSENRKVKLRLIVR